MFCLLYRAPFFPSPNPRTFQSATPILLCPSSSSQTSLRLSICFTALLYCYIQCSASLSLQKVNSCSHIVFFTYQLFLDVSCPFSVRITAPCNVVEYSRFSSHTSTLHKQHRFAPGRALYLSSIFQLCKHLHRVGIVEIKVNYYRLHCRTVRTTSISRRGVR